MSHELHLHKIGPINDCRLTLDSFTILTGPQANGKSTAAKAVYFFRSVKQDILSIMMQGGQTQLPETRLTLGAPF